MTLGQLSAAATELLPCPFCGGVAELDHYQPFRAYRTGEPLDQPAVYCTECSAQIAHYPKDIGLDRTDTAELVMAAWNQRTGQLVAVADDAIERVARTLAPNLEGGREFDQMPKDRVQLRQWTAQGMCLINDATQDDATWLAQEAIAALAAKGTGDELPL